MRLNKAENNLEELGPKVNNWYELQRQLKQIKAEEMALRKQIVSAITNNGVLKSNVREIAGFELKAENKITYALDKVAYEQAELTEEEKCSLKFSVSIKPTQYNKLPGSCVLKSQLVTLKPAAPALTVVSVLE